MPLGLVAFAALAWVDIASRFDVITCLFSAIAYVQTIDKVEAAIARMCAHLNQWPREI